jgi:hypothetical protein
MVNRKVRLLLVVLFLLLIQMFVFHILELDWDQKIPTVEAVLYSD